jgi:hypothetical protein
MDRHVSRLDTNTDDAGQRFAAVGPAADGSGRLHAAARDDSAAPR